MPSSLPHKTAAVSGVAGIEIRKSSLGAALMSALLDEGADVHAPTDEGGVSCDRRWLRLARGSRSPASRRRFTCVAIRSGKSGDGSDGSGDRGLRGGVPSAARCSCWSRGETAPSGSLDSTPLLPVLPIQSSSDTAVAASALSRPTQPDVRRPLCRRFGVLQSSVHDARGDSGLAWDWLLGEAKGWHGGISGDASGSMPTTTVRTRLGARQSDWALSAADVEAPCGVVGSDPPELMGEMGRILAAAGAKPTRHSCRAGARICAKLRWREAAKAGCNFLGPAREKPF